MSNLFIRLATEWDGFTVHPGEFHDAGSVVVVEGRYTGRPNSRTRRTRARRRQAENAPMRSR
jgi:hypothetical protein